MEVHYFAYHPLDLIALASCNKDGKKYKGCNDQIEYSGKMPQPVSHLKSTRWNGN